MSRPAGLRQIKLTVVKGELAGRPTADQAHGYKGQVGRPAYGAPGEWAGFILLLTAQIGAAEPQTDRVRASESAAGCLDGGEEKRPGKKYAENKCVSSHLLFPSSFCLLRDGLIRAIRLDIFHLIPAVGLHHLCGDGGGGEGGVVSAQETDVSLASFEYEVGGDGRGLE
jgi:hypothetical protein